MNKLTDEQKYALRCLFSKMEYKDFYTLMKKCGAFDIKDTIIPGGINSLQRFMNDYRCYADISIDANLSGHYFDTMLIVKHGKDGQIRITGARDLGELPDWIVYNDLWNILESMDIDAFNTFVSNVYDIVKKYSDSEDLESKYMTARGDNAVHIELVMDVVTDLKRIDGESPENYAMRVLGLKKSDGCYFNIKTKVL